VPPSVATDHDIDAPFEFRIMHLRNADLTIRAIELQQIQDWEMAPRSYLQWRLLGRLYPTSMGSITERPHWAHDDHRLVLTRLAKVHGVPRTAW
jgi:hypothetical protein